jgi:D-glycero-D-manno-heptose 1,7-bisphosphate phosphatase
VSRRRAAILDRDGTLVEFVKDLDVLVPAWEPAQLRFLPGALEALRLLADAGFALAVATNQPQVAKGQRPRAAIERTNAALAERLAAAGVPVLAIEVCLHHPEGGPGGDPSLILACDCRKPRPGMLLALAARFDFDPAASIFIGDQSSDVEAARAAGMRAGFIGPTTGGLGADVAGASLLDVAREVVRAT